MESAGPFPPHEAVADGDFNPLSNATSLPVMLPQPYPAVYPGYQGGVYYSQAPPLLTHTLASHDVLTIFTPSIPSSHCQISDIVSPYAADVQQGSPYTSTTPYQALSSDSSPSSTAASRHQAPVLSKLDSSDLSDPILRGEITHPYSRLYSMQGDGKTRKRRRKMWNLSLEKKLFKPEEISAMSGPYKRVIYTASLEAHIDRLHDQLASYSLGAVDPKALIQYGGLNIKTAKSMVSGLQHDLTELELKILEIERANKNLEERLRCDSKN